MRADVRWLAGMSWRSIAGLVAVACGFAVYSMPSVLFLPGGVGSKATSSDYTVAFFGWFVRYLVGFGPVLVALTIADNLPLAGVKRIGALAGALMIGANVQWPVRCVYEPETEEPACAHFPSSLWRSWNEMNHYTLSTIAFSAPIALVYLYRRRDIRVAKALHAAELARMDLQRKTLAADLQTMQARIEPAFLLDTLGDIGALFDRDAANGERMLDELIRYLRAALPDTHAANSTLREEIALARAYLAILQIRAHGRLAVDVDVARHGGGIVMPPMMVLPLVAAAIGSMGITAGDRSSSIRVIASLDAGRAEVAIAANGMALRAMAGDPIVHAIRERLHALYGDRASLALEADAGWVVTARLAIPREDI
jgi:hypothetical protein